MYKRGHFLMAEAGGDGGTGGTGGTGTGATGATEKPWTEGFDADTLGYVTNKQWSGPADVLKSYRNLEKLHGVPAEKLVKVPDPEDVEGWKQAYQRLGAPDTADKYDIPLPKEGGDEAYAKWARETFHGAGLNVRQAKAVVEAHNKYMAEHAAAQATKYQESVAADEAALKGEWKADYEANMAAAKRAAAAFGWTGETIDKLEKALGYPALMKMAHEMGKRLGTDDGFVEGDGGNGGGGTPSSSAGAIARIAELRKDKAFCARFAAGDAEAKAEMKRLHAVAYPGDTQL